jgi:hypothetical protein
MLGIIECAARSAEWPLASGSRSGYLSAVTAHQSPYDFFECRPGILFNQTAKLGRSRSGPSTSFL